MFKRILVPLDGSTRAERAIPVAARIARASRGSIVLLRALIPPVEFGGYLTQPLVMETPQELAVEEAEAKHYLTRVTYSETLSGIATEIAVYSGAAAPVILEAAKSQAADLIVMCSHGNTGLTRWILGSVAQKVVHHAPVPVVVLRQDTPIPTGSHPIPDQPLRVLIPLDGSPLAEEAIEPASQLIASLAAPGRGAIHLMRVVNLPVIHGKSRSQAHIDTSMIDQAKEEAKKKTKHTQHSILESPLAKLDLLLTCVGCVWFVVSHAIINVAENGEDVEGLGVFGGCDLIAMATHGRGGLQYWALGSVTERVLGATKHPLLVVRPVSKESDVATHAHHLTFKRATEDDLHTWQALF